MGVIHGEKNEEILMGPRAKAAIESGSEAPISREYAREVVEQKSMEARERVKKEAEAELTDQQKAIMEKLQAAKGSEERVKVFAQIADDIGLDPLLSLIPELGDGASSIVSGVYLLMEAKKAGLGPMSYLKIIGLEAADFAVGAIPVAGDVADYFFKANKWGAKSFEAQTKELVEKARKAGVPEEKIQILMQKAEKWPQLAGKAVGLAASAKKHTSAA